MHTKPHLNQLEKLVERLTRPSACVEAVEQRQQARTLALLSAILLIAIVTTAPIFISISANPPVFRAIVIGAILAFALIYSLSRSQFYKAGAGSMLSKFMGQTRGKIRETLGK